MNYKNNMDTYYAYAKEDKKRRKREEKVTWIWFILSILILLIVWAYLNILNTKSAESDLDSSKVVLVEKVDEKISTKESISAIKTKKLEKPIDEEKKFTASSLIVKKDMDSKNISLEKVAKVQGNEIEASRTILNENVLMASLKGTDINSSKVNIAASAQAQALKSELEVASLDQNKSEVKVTILDQNKSLQSEVKVASLDQNKSELKEKLPVDLYHIYIVAKGESIYDIARKQYGDTGMYIKIVNANLDLINPNNIHEGEELFLPIVDESKSYSDILNFK